MNISWFVLSSSLILWFCAAAHGQESRIVDAASGKFVLSKVRSIQVPADLQPNGRRLLAENSNGYFSVVGVKGGVHYFNLDTGESKICRGPKNGTYARVAISRAGETIAGYKDGTITIWDANTCRTVANINSKVEKDILLSPEGNYLFFNDLQPTVWDVRRNSKAYEFSLLRAGVDPRTTSLSSSLSKLVTADFAARGGVIAISYYYWVVVWNLKTGDADQIFSDPNIARDRIAQNGIYRVAFNADGRLLATSGLDGRVKIWNVSTARLISTMDIEDKVWGRTAFSEDSRHIATTGSKGKLSVWDIQTGEKKWVASANNRIPYFSDTEVALVSTEDGKVRDLSTGREIEGLVGELLPNGRFIADDDDGAVSIWKISRR